MFRYHASEVELFRERVDGEFLRGLASGTLMWRLSLAEVTLSSRGAPLALMGRTATALQQYLILFVEDKKQGGYDALGGLHGILGKFVRGRMSFKAPVKGCETRWRTFNMVGIPIP